VRHAGARFLSAPQPVGPYAAEDWEFAWFAASAYDKTHAGAKRRAHAVDPESQASPELALRAAGRECWVGFPSRKLDYEVEPTHLRVEVWQKQRADGTLVVAVTFGAPTHPNLLPPDPGGYVFFNCQPIIRDIGRPIMMM